LRNASHINQIHTTNIDNDDEEEEVVEEAEAEAEEWPHYQNLTILLYNM
jgi:hypothetical protein